jgi:hypothetical protein
MRRTLANSTRIKIELLGFPGCPNTPKMRGNLASALKLLGGGLTIQDVNLQSLSETDGRRGWAAPTVLVNGEDLFGSAAASGMSMGCRLYAGGVPDARQIAERLQFLQTRAKLSP